MFVSYTYVRMQIVFAKQWIFMLWQVHWLERALWGTSQRFVFFHSEFQISSIACMHVCILRITYGLNNICKADLLSLTFSFERVINYWPIDYQTSTFEHVSRRNSHLLCIGANLVSPLKCRGRGGFRTESQSKCFCIILTWFPHSN